MKSIIRSSLKCALLGTSIIAAAANFGCEGRPTLFANPDPALRHTSTEFAADSARRFPYDQAAPHGTETKCRAQAAYMLNRLEIVNFTGRDWNDVDVWVNQEYVCHVPKMEDRKLKEVHFPMLYNDRGEHFPMGTGKEIVRKVEVCRDGKFYDVVVHNADF